MPYRDLEGEPSELARKSPAILELEQHIAELGTIGIQIPENVWVGFIINFPPGSDSNPIQLRDVRLYCEQYGILEPSTAYNATLIMWYSNKLKKWVLKTTNKGKVLEVKNEGI